MISTPNKELKRAIEMAISKLVSYATKKKLMQVTFLAECVNDHKQIDQDKIGLETSNVKQIQADSNSENQDPLIEVNHGTKEKPRVTFISGHLGPNEFTRMLKC